MSSLFINRLLLSVFTLSMTHICWAQVIDCTVVNGAIATVNQNCHMQPQEYGATIYRVGLCQAAPAAPTHTNPINLSACSVVFESSAGSAVLVSKGVSTPLSGSVNRPPIGNYTHVFVELAPEVRIRASYSFTPPRNNNPKKTPDVNNTKCWSRNGDFYSYRNNSAFVSGLVGCGNTVPADHGITKTKINALESDGQNAVYSRDFGSIQGHLVTTAGTLATSTPGNMGTVAKVIAISPLNASVTNTTSGIDISFNVTQGTSLEMDSLGTAIEAFGAGPFVPRITVR